MGCQKLLSALILILIFVSFANAVTIHIAADDYYSPSTRATAVVKAVEDDGSPAELRENYSLQYVIFYEDMSRVVYEGSGEYSNGYWYLNFVTPNAAGVYVLDVFVYDRTRNETRASARFQVGPQAVTPDTPQPTPPPGAEPQCRAEYNDEGCYREVCIDGYIGEWICTAPVPVECKEERNERGCYRKVCSDGYVGGWNCPIDDRVECKEERNERGCYRKVCSDGSVSEWVCPKVECKKEDRADGCYREICSDGYTGKWICKEPVPVPHKFEQCLVYETTEQKAVAGYTITDKDRGYLPPEEKRGERCGVKQCCYADKEFCEETRDSSGAINWKCKDGSTKYFKEGKGNIDNLVCKKRTIIPQGTGRGVECFEKTCNDGTIERICIGENRQIQCEDSRTCAIYEDYPKPVPTPDYECECKTWRDEYCVYAQCAGEMVQKVCLKAPEKRERECDESEYYADKENCYEKGGMPYPYRDEYSCPKIKCDYSKPKCPDLEKIEERLKHCEKQEGYRIESRTDPNGCKILTCVKHRREIPPNDVFCPIVVDKLYQIDKDLEALILKLDRLVNYYSVEEIDTYKAEALNNVLSRFVSMRSSLLEMLPSAKEECLRFSEEQLIRLRDGIIEFSQSYLPDVIDEIERIIAGERPQPD